MVNVITLGLLIGLLFCSLPPLYFVFENSKKTRNELARPVMGTIILVIIIIIFINFFQTGFSECTEAIATSHIPLDAILPEFVLLSLVLAVLCGLHLPTVHINSPHYTAATTLDSYKCRTWKVCCVSV